jgi:hypothetical protein
MNKQLYIKGSNGFVKKISRFRDGSLSDTIEVEQRKRWYSLPWDAEVCEFDPNTLTITTLVPANTLR